MKWIVVLLLVFAAILISGCSLFQPSYTVTLSPSTINDYVGKTVPLTVTFSSSQSGALSGVKLESTCHSLNVGNQSADSNNPGKISTSVTIVNYMAESNCLKFVSSKHSENLPVQIQPLQPATFNLPLSYPQNFPYNVYTRVTLALTSKERADKTLRIRFNSGNPQLMYSQDGLSNFTPLDSAILLISVPQSTTNFVGDFYIRLPTPDTNLLNSPLSPITVYLEIGDAWYPVDTAIMKGIIVGNKPKQ